MGEASPRYFGHFCPESSLRSLESGEMRNASEILQPLTGKLGERGAHFLNHTGSDWRFHCLVEVWRAGGNRPWVKPPRFVTILRGGSQGSACIQRELVTQGRKYGRWGVAGAPVSSHDGPSSWTTSGTFRLQSPAARERAR